jgi:leucyl-tRNA synthetase
MKATRASLRTGELNAFDLGFQAEMDNHISLAYGNFERSVVSSQTYLGADPPRMEYKEALKRGLYDFEIARNWYRSVTSPENGGPGLHGDLIFSWIRNNALMIAPFTPHFSEHVWKNILGETASVQKASFPQPSQAVDPVKLQEIDYMRGVVDSMRSAEAVLSKRKGKAAKTAPAFDPSKPKSARVYVATEFPDWQNKGVELVRDAWNEQEGTIDDVRLRQALDAAGLSKDKKAMPFCQSFKVRRPAADCNGRVLTISSDKCSVLGLPLSLDLFRSPSWKFCSF